MNIINDRRILEIASFAKNYYKNEVTFISLDIMARTRAVSLDIPTDSLVGSNKEEFNYEYIKNIEVEFEEIEFLENALITDL